MAVCTSCHLSSCRGNYRFLRYQVDGQPLGGDFGKSTFLGRSAFAIAMSRLPATLELAGVAILICILLALPLGVYAAVNRGRFFDVGARIFAVLGQSLPSFWLGLMLMLVFAVWLGILPIAGRGGPLNIVLPAVTIGYYQVSGITRLLRSSMLDVLDSEYIKLARIKGLSERLVLWKHGFKNALIPVLTFAVIVFVHLLSGAVVTETVFAWPGIGRLVIQAVTWRDYPIVQAAVIIMAAMNIAANLGVDILYAYINPKVRYGK